MHAFRVEALALAKAAAPLRAVLLLPELWKLLSLTVQPMCPRRALLQTSERSQLRGGEMALTDTFKRATGATSKGVNGAAFAPVTAPPWLPYCALILSHRTVVLAIDSAIVSPPRCAS